MRRLFPLFAALAVLAWAANVKLYLKDGSYQVVREYQVQPDRVRFYSIERSDWEEMPLDLVDLKRTESEASARQAEVEKEAKIISEEDKAARALQDEAMKIPQDPGVYWVENGQAKMLRRLDANVKTQKGRALLARLSPAPVITGKGTLELDEPHSRNIFANPEQEFYIQLNETERFGILRLKTRGEVRIIENLTFMPVTKEVLEENTPVETLSRELAAGGLYKIWPKEPLENGEYAVVEYTQGKLNMLVWDFAIKLAK